PPPVVRSGLSPAARPDPHPPSLPDALPIYTALSPGAIAAAGGRFVARGGAVDVLEGDWQPGRIVVLEFEPMAAARAFYDSPLYRDRKSTRLHSSHVKSSYAVVCLKQQSRVH